MNLSLNYNFIAEIKLHAVSIHVSFEDGTFLQLQYTDQEGIDKRERWMFVSNLKNAKSKQSYYIDIITAEICGWKEIESLERLQRDLACIISHYADSRYTWKYNFD